MIIFIWVILFLFSLILPPSHYFNFGILLFGVFSVFNLLKSEQAFSFLFSYFLWGMVTASICCFFVEFGVFFPELSLTSYLTGATARNIFLCYFFTLFSLIGFKWLDKKRNTFVVLPFSLNKFIEIFFLYSYVISVLLLVFIFFLYGSPNDYSADRFYYWNNVAPAWGISVRVYIEQLSCILGVLFAFKNQKRYLFLFLCGCLSQYLVGEKFTGFVGAILLFTIPYFILHNEIKFRLFSFKNITLLCFLLFICVFFIVQSYLSIGGDGLLALASLTTRFFSQAQLWWAIDEISGFFQIRDINEIWLHYVGVSDNAGITYFMSKLMPKNLFDIYSESGIALTMAGFTNNMYFFGYILSVFPVGLIGICTGICLSFFKKSILSKDYVFIFLTVKLYYMCLQISLMGRTYILFSFKYLFLIFCFMLYMMMMNKFVKR